MRVLSDRLPNNSVKPRFGVVMSHTHAKAFLRALTSTIGMLEKMLGHEIQLEVPAVADAPSATQNEQQ